MKAKMKQIVIAVLFISLLIVSAEIHEIGAYTGSFKSQMASLIIKELPYNWYYSFSAYQTNINAGIALSLDSNATLYYTPKNASGPLIDDAILAYNDMLAQLNKSDIKSAANAFGRLLGYTVYLSDPYRTTDMMNSSLAKSFEAMILDSDIYSVMIYKNITISEVSSALANIGFKAISLSSMLNKTSISREQRDSNYLKFINVMMSYVASVLYALLIKAISEHNIDVTQRNLYYIIVLSGIVIALVVFANRKRLKSIRK